ncbi:phenylalanine--tRNA ligase beta subunit-related protein [Pullulanibacillus sp. KACC 23026]|uniref:B3/B4 domain-containing protein n=1 Tax=Pullulanibacillus sp. KACC 23026 TaxID=3028315 RepID=UPI0023B0961E|nr:phenylalanine--tRNA ligase beta subunit-related protein [Pullulanibacillus sp. KACC 23026]WEG12161.1 phenylalanine--tRNA ligase beta subunit-related protein [Pullulanibacillus sp. KACC 23026]
MVQLSIDPAIFASIPDFKIGMITYHDITVRETPQMLKGRIQLFYEERKLAFADKTVTDIEGIKEWRSIFKKIGTDPSRYRPSHEALIRRLIKDQPMPEVQSAVDLMNFFSIRHEIPMGLYDLGAIVGEQLEIRKGRLNDHYEGINGRDMGMEGKLLSADAAGAFGSPIVDSKRTMVTKKTTDALHLVYIRPSMDRQSARDLMAQLQTQFIQIHGGKSSARLITGTEEEII